ncbi:foldase protein PrsA [Caenispirillum bisanense]|uniref:foldase protein PrsA n=1 Tax=Caenispirillum bisanense TaxID=414052 RepID=UPI0031CDEF5D
MAVKFLRAALSASVLATAALAVPTLVAAPVLAQDKAAENPVVAKVGKDEIRRSDLIAMKEAMAQQMPQLAMLPLEAVYRPLLERAVDSKLLARAAADQGLAKSDEVKQRLKEAEERIMQQVYLEQLVETQVTDAQVKAAYDAFLKDNPPEPEVHARHILVKSEEEAKDVIAQLKKGKDFAELATEKSDGPSGSKGGDLGYFTQGDMVPEFAAAAFAMKPGDISESPVQTQFGWHVIKVEDRRQSQPPALEEVRDQLHQQVAGQVIEQKMTELRTKADVKLFGLDGKDLPAENTGDKPAQ